MYQYFARERKGKTRSDFVHKDKVKFYDDYFWTPFSGTYKTIEEAFNWMVTHGAFFTSRGIILTLFMREGKECSDVYEPIQQ